MLSPLRARAHQDGERGAVAILVVLVVLFLALPASALGLTAFVRVSALAELQQTADAAALAGASTIPLGDLDHAVAFADALAASATGPSDADLPPLGGAVGAPVVRPLDNACAQARASARSLGFRGSFALPAATPVTDDGYVQVCSGDTTVPGEAGPVANTGPSASEGFARVKYFQDLNVVTALGRCLDALPVDLDALPLDPRLPLPVSTVKGLAQALPALLHPGVVVQVRQDVRGPLDQLVRPGAAPETQVVTARARRRPKNLVVLPYQDGVLPVRPAGTVTSSSARLRLALEQTADLLESAPDSVGLDLEVDTDLPGLELDLEADPSVPLPGSALRTCAGLVRAVLDDYDDLVAPDDANSVDETIRLAAEGDEPLTVVLLGPGATFLDTLQVCQPALVQRRLSADAPDADGDGLPDRVEADATVQVQVNSDEVLEGVRCQPGTPGSFRATLVRD